MKVFREFTISGSRETLVATIAEIEKKLSDGWKRNREVEEHLDQDGLANVDLRFCFTCEPLGSRKGARLMLMSSPDENLRLVNIVPNEFGQLTHDEFNAILEEFAVKFAKPAAATTGALIELSNDIVTLEDWFSRTTAEKLRRFLAVTRGSTSHPSDDLRWKAFLIAAHREDAQVHGDLLRRWLEEDAGCSEYVAQRLASEYQFSQEIFRFAEENVGV